VKVIGCSGAPAKTAAAVDRLDAVIVGAIADASPMPIALVARYVAAGVGETLFTVTEHCSGVAVAAVAAAALTSRVVAIVDAVTVVVPRVTPALQPLRVSVAFEEKPLPEIVIGVVATTAATADGVTSLISLPEIVKTEPEVTAPPSGFVTVTVYAPMVAGRPVTEFVGSTVTVRLVALPKVADPWTPVVTLPAVNAPVAELALARVVPFVAFVIATVAPETKPAPVTVTVVAVAVARSTRDAGLTEVNAGSALTTIALATVTVPPSSVIEMLYVPGTVADVDAYFAEAAVALDSAAPLNVRPGAFDVMVTLPPSLIKPVPVIATLPEAPLPNALAVPGVNTTVTPAGAAPADVAIAIGSAAAASKAPAAKAFTKWRCIRLGLFINSLHS
jgi:hypothetical protein